MTNFPPKNILVPVDFSEIAEHATGYAFNLARSLGAKVHLLHAYLLPSLPQTASGAEELAQKLEVNAQTEMKRIADKHKESGLVGQLLVRLGDPRDSIVRTAKELPSDLIVMSSHGRQGLSRMLLGSVAETVVRTAPCPVLVVRAESSQAG